MLRRIFPWNWFTAPKPEPITQIAAEHAWYLAGTFSDIQQGDFLDRCPVLIPVDYTDLAEYAISRSGRVRGDVRDYDLVVMTQTCDITQSKADYLTLCPRYDWTKFARDNPKLSSKAQQGNIRSGRIEGLLVLQDWTERGMDFQVVDLRNVISLPVDYVRALANRSGERIRLKSPYRESVSHTFGRCFSRVALDPELRRFGGGS